MNTFVAKGILVIFILLITITTDIKFLRMAGLLILVIFFIVFFMDDSHKGTRSLKTNNKFQTQFN